MAGRRSAKAAPGQAYLPGMAPALPGLPIPDGAPRSMAAALQICGMVSMALDKARLEKGLSRAVVAAKMSDLTGEEISDHMLNACSSESKEGHRFPVQWAAAFCWVTGDDSLLRHMAALMGGVLLTGDAAWAAKAAEMEVQAAALKRAAGEIKRNIGGGYV
jgi:hypothetical protein